MKYQIDQPMSLIEALQSFYPESSKRTLENWIRAGRVLIADKKAERKDDRLKQGDTLSLLNKSRISNFGIKYIYEDRWMVVIEKPPFLLSVATDDDDEENALAMVRDDLLCDVIYPVHRLDRDSSGVLLFARGKASQDKFDALFEAHDLTRQYIAIIEGRLPSKKGIWESHLIEKENYEVVVTSPELGKKAITHYEVIRYSKKFTYLALTLETGRKHQIRVHCKEAGFPILGDKRYGSQCNPIKRLALHACRLSFKHPFTGKNMDFQAQMPNAMKILGAQH